VSDPRTSAVVIIECQEGVVGERSVLPALAKAAGPVLPTMGRLAGAARDAGVVVVHLTYVPAAGGRSSNRKAPLMGRVLELQAAWGPDSPEVQVVDIIGVEEGDLVLPRHSGLSPTHGTETFKILRNLGVTTLILAGVSTNIAIPITAVEAVDEGFEVVIPSDAVAGTPADHSTSMLRNSLAFVATLTTVDELVASWRGV
jgi:nicotinamidase-related amidase